MAADCDRLMHEQTMLTQSATPGSVIGRFNFSQ